MRWAEACHAAAGARGGSGMASGARGCPAKGRKGVPGGGRGLLANPLLFAWHLIANKMHFPKISACIPSGGRCRVATRCRTEGTASPPGAPPPRGQRGKLRPRRRTLPHALWKPKPLHDTQGRHPAARAPRPKRRGPGPRDGWRTCRSKQDVEDTGPRRSPVRVRPAAEADRRRARAPRPGRGGGGAGTDFFMESLILAQNERWQRG